MPMTVTPAKVAQFRHDGFVHLPAIADADAVASLATVADLLLECPQQLMAVNGEALPDSYLWLSHAACQQALMQLPLAEIAGALMGCARVRLFQDQMFSKPPGFNVATPWHQDASHWCLAGEQICTIWLALDDVDIADGAMCYLPGSHRHGQVHAPCGRDGQPWPGVAGDPLPPVDEAHTRVCTARAGDVIAHHGRTVHGSRHNARGRHHRRAYVTRWLGPDVVFEPRGFEMPLPLAVPMIAGEPLSHPLFPLFDLGARMLSERSSLV